MPALFLLLSCYLHLSFQTLVNSKKEVGQLLLHHAKYALVLFERGLQRAQEEIFAISAEDPASTYRLKKKLRARIYDFAVNQDPIKGCLPRASDVNRFMCVRGTVVRTGQPKMLEVCLHSFDPQFLH
jgi:DNA replicative helicase MCM subunit Mcm2 (Cdc46/Mcm family)